MSELRDELRALLRGANKARLKKQRPSLLSRLLNKLNKPSSGGCSSGACSSCHLAYWCSLSRLLNKPSSGGGADEIKYSRWIGRIDGVGMVESGSSFRKRYNACASSHEDKACAIVFDKESNDIDLFLDLMEIMIPTEAEWEYYLEWGNGGLPLPFETLSGVNDVLKDYWKQHYPEIQCHPRWVGWKHPYSQISQHFSL